MLAEQLNNIQQEKKSRHCKIVPLKKPAYPKPFVKWAGGKRQLLDELKKRLPDNIKDYYEPFIGGGALMWSLNKSSINSITINDYNEELINLYRVIKSTPDELIESLKKHKNDSGYYYEIRSLDREPSFREISSVERASRFLFLNKTGFNGLHRVNSKGQNNVPFGKYKNPTIFIHENIQACSDFLQSVTILSGDFEKIKPLINQDSFVYLDPPYAPINKTSCFTSYTENGFDNEMQIRLKNFCDFINNAGGRFMLSNSSTPLIHELYRGYTLDEVFASRAINSKGSGRGKVPEVIITNY